MTRNKKDIKLIVALTIAVLLVVYLAYKQFERGLDPRPGGMPAQVYKAFTAKYPNATIDNWTLRYTGDPDAYTFIGCDIKASENGKRYQLTIDTTGKYWLEKSFYTAPIEKAHPKILDTLRKVRTNPLDRYLYINRNGRITYYVYEKMIRKGRTDAQDVYVFDSAMTIRTVIQKASTSAFF